MSSSNDATPNAVIRWNAKEYLWLSGILLLGGALRLWHLGHSGLWESEIIRVFIATRPDFSTLLSSISNFVATPPVDFFILRLFLTTLGRSPIGVNAPAGPSDFLARSPAALWGILSIWFVYVTGRRLFNGRTGLLAAFLLAISPFHIQYSQEVGPYSAFLGLSCLSILWFHQALEENSLKAWAGYTAFTALALYTHYFAVILILVEALFLTWARWGSMISLSLKVQIVRRVDTEKTGAPSHWRFPFTIAASLERGPGSSQVNSRVLQNFFLSGLRMLILYAPWLLFGLRHSSATASEPTLTWSLLADTLAAFSGGYGLLRVVYLGVFAWGCLTMWRACCRNVILLLGWLILPIPLAAALRWANLHLNMGDLICILPAYLLVVSRGLESACDYATRFIAHITRRRKRISRIAATAILVGIFALLSGFPVVGYYQSEKVDWRAIAAFLDAHLSPDHVIVLPFPTNEPVWREISLRAYLDNENISILTIEDPATELESLWAAHQGLWFVGRGFGLMFQVRKELTELGAPVIHLIFGRNDGHELVQQITPAPFEDIHVLYASHQLKADDTMVNKTRDLFSESDYQMIRQEFTLAETIRQYGSDRKDSLSLYNEALYDAPDYLKVYICILQGNIHRSAGEVKAAIDAYRAAISLNPKASLAYYGLAMAYEKRAQRARAIAAWETFLRLEPTGERAETAHRRLQRLRK